jgi:hypothetical protein
MKNEEINSLRERLAELEGNGQPGIVLVSHFLVTDCDIFCSCIIHQ